MWVWVQPTATTGRILIKKTEETYTMVKTAVFAISIALLTMASPFATKMAMAQEDLASVMADRDHLRDRLRRAIAVSKERGAKLEAAEAGRSDLRDRLRRAVAFSKERGAKLEVAEAGRSDVTDRLRRAVAFSKERGAKLEAAEAGRSDLRNRLRRAVAFSKERAAKLETAETGRDYLRDRLRTTIAASKEQGAQLETAEAGRSDLRGRLRRAVAFSKERGAKLEAANAGRDELRGRLRRAIAYSKASRMDLEQQLANANTSGASAEWASAVGSSLESSIGGLQGTEVITTSDNAVKIQVGNNGLFRTGGNALSDNGERLLSDIAPQILAQDAAITVVGHTDSIPVGAANRFGSNEALSFARALSTLQFLRGQGIPAQRLSASGFGADEPIASNDTEAGRQQNRRVDIVLRAQ